MLQLLMKGPQKFTKSSAKTQDSELHSPTLQEESKLWVIITNLKKMPYCYQFYF